MSISWSWSPKEAPGCSRRRMFTPSATPGESPGMARPRDAAVSPCAHWVGRRRPGARPTCHPDHHTSTDIIARGAQLSPVARLCNYNATAPIAHRPSTSNMPVVEESRRPAGSGGPRQARSWESARARRAAIDPGTSGAATRWSPAPARESASDHSGAGRGGGARRRRGTQGDGRARRPGGDRWVVEVHSTCPPPPARPASSRPALGRAGSTSWSTTSAPSTPNLTGFLDDHRRGLVTR